MRETALHDPAQPESVRVPRYGRGGSNGGSNMAWLAPALGAVGGLASSGLSAYGALSGDDQLNTQKVQAPGWARGLQNMFARAIAQNAFNTAPSFGDFISSGGTARFPTNFTGMSPQEARLLGFVGNAGEPLPFTGINRTGDQAQTELTPDQRLYLAAQDLKSGRRGPLRNLARIDQRRMSLEAKAELPGLSDRRQANLERKIKKTSSRYQDLYESIMRRGHGTGDEYAGDPQYNQPRRMPRKSAQRRTSPNSYDRRNPNNDDRWYDRPGPWKGAL